MTIIIYYAHCVKQTPGQLDRYPFSLYEAREAEANATSFVEEYHNVKEWIIRSGHQILANEDTLNSAIASASYYLMDQSRKKAMQDASQLQEQL